ncbi:MAG: hypothetical protein RL071_2573 [Pseudomonadota bacterium]
MHAQDDAPPPPAAAPTSAGAPLSSHDAPFDFGGAVFDLHHPDDHELVRFMLSQALYGEATGVYCGRSLYAAGSLEAARFYLRQARQELNHLELFADIFRALNMQPMRAHWAVRLLAAHNDYYPLKVMMEHAIGEGMVLDIFRDVLLQTLPDSDPRIPAIKKKLRVVCKEEEEHVAWGEKETRRLLAARPGLALPFYGLIELQLAVAPAAARALAGRAGDHPVLRQLPAFLAHVDARVRRQAVALGIAPAIRPGPARRALAMAAGVLLYLRSQLSRSRSQLEHIYIRELGFPG